MKENETSSKKTDNSTISGHPVCGHSTEVQIDYIFIIGLMAAADGIISNEERDYMGELADKFDIPMGDREDIMIRIRCYSEDIAKALEPFRSTDIRFSLIWDLIIMQYADGVIMEEETAYLKKITDYLKVSQKQSDFMIKLMEKSREKDSFEELRKTFEYQLKELNIPSEYILF